MTNNTGHTSQGIIVLAIIAIAILEGLAIWKGLDGKMFAGAIGAICALGGVEIGRILGRKEP